MSESKIQQQLYSYEQCKKDRDALYDEIGMIRARIESIYGGCHGGAADDIHVMNGTVSDSVSSAVIGQVIPEQEHLERMLKRLEAKEKAIGQVEQWLDLLDALERSVIECRYFEHMTWEKVREATFFSTATAYRIHAGAIRKLIAFDSV
jgi:hypothetical protein